MAAQECQKGRGNSAPGEAPMLKAALRYAAMGWLVFPCKADKTPRTRHGVKDATIDNAQIRQWWTLWPDANIAVATGSKSGIVAIDIDIDKGSGDTIGENTLFNLEAAHGRFPTSIEAETPSGGRHYLFRHPGGTFPNTVQKLGPGIDTRGDGGYVLVEPSKNRNGAYSWEQGRGPGEIEPAPLPDWLADMLAPEDVAGPMPVLSLPPEENTVRSAYAQKAFNDELVQLQKAAPGSRNDSLNRAAFSLGQLVGGGHLDRHDVTGQLFAIAVNLLGLPDKEAGRTIKSGLESGLKKPRVLPHVGDLNHYIRDNERGDARLFAQAAEGMLLFDHTAKSWFRWVGHWWEPDRVNTAIQMVDEVVEFYEQERQRLKSESEKAKSIGNQTKAEGVEKVLTKVNKRIRDLQTARRRKAVLELATAGESPVSFSGEGWDRNPRLIGLSNGVLILQPNCRQTLFRPGYQEDFIKTPMPTPWPGEVGPYGLDELKRAYNAPTWNRFLNDVFAGDDQILDYIQRIFGYCLSGEPNQHVLPIMYGSAAETARPH